MNKKGKILLLCFLALLTTAVIAFTKNQNPTNNKIVSYIVDTKTQDLQLYWKNDKGEILKSIQNLKSYVEQKNLTLSFAMNGGMFKKDFSPQGLFIQDKKVLMAVDTMNGIGNFYLQPNGVFYVTTNGIAFVCKTADFIDNGQITYATQSGPMLVIDGQIHTAFKEGSTNLNIRNGVGILPNNQVVFAISKSEINFYDFAKYFQSLGCKNALYLDGFVSKAYIPEKNWIQTDGNFAVMIGITKQTIK
ncbi:MAG: phosphodiester glycosidase family protein [Bacteroidetes bacterium]|nr:phosphodiester glycosidase family protein [Bacteroidota bacterium]